MIHGLGILSLWAYDIDCIVNVNCTSYEHAQFNGLLKQFYIYFPVKKWSWSEYFGVHRLIVNSD